MKKGKSKLILFQLLQFRPYSFILRNVRVTFLDALRHLQACDYKMKRLLFSHGKRQIYEKRSANQALNHVFNLQKLTIYM